VTDTNPGGERGQQDRLTDRIGLGVLTRLVHRDLVDEVLADTGRTERRRRLLPARVVVYFVLAMTLFFDDAYEEVMRKLVEGLRFLRSWNEGWQVPTSSALCQARVRLRVHRREQGPLRGRSDLPRAFIQSGETSVRRGCTNVEGSRWALALR